VTPEHAPRLAALIVEGLRAKDSVGTAARTAEMRAEFQAMHFVRQ